MRRSLLQPILALLLVLTVSVLPILETDNTHHQKAISLVEFSIAGTSNNSNNYTSNLSWGPNSGLNAFASVDTPMTMSINITNGANVSDAVDFYPSPVMLAGIVSGSAQSSLATNQIKSLLDQGN